MLARSDQEKHRAARFVLPFCQAAIKAVDDARKRAGSALDSLRQDDRYGWLRGLAVEAITTAIRSYVPGSGVVLDNSAVKKASEGAAQLTQEQLAHLRDRLRDRLGTTLDDYLDPALRLGLALGHDLSELARNCPLLLFLDTYEEIDEADQLLRKEVPAQLQPPFLMDTLTQCCSGSG